MKLDFAIIGAQKCGTSSLAYQLAQHPEVCFCLRKEPHYFSRNANWQASLARYHRLFRPTEGQICGEASTTYTCAPEFVDTHARLSAYNPDLKLIYIMRNPVDRIVSQYGHDFTRRRIQRRPELEVLENPMYINRSRYAYQLQPYFDVFSCDRVLLLIFEEFIQDPQRELHRVARFLQISALGFDAVDMSPQNRSRGNKRFLGIKSLRTDLYKAWQLLNFKRLRFLSGSGRRIFYRNPGQVPEFSGTLKRQLHEILEDDVTALERIMDRRLDEFRSACVKQCGLG